MTVHELDQQLEAVYNMGGGFTVEKIYCRRADFEALLDGHSTAPDPGHAGGAFYHYGGKAIPVEFEELSHPDHMFIVEAICPRPNHLAWGLALTSIKRINPA